MFVLRPQLHRHLQDGDICGGLPAHEQVSVAEIVLFCSSWLECGWKSDPRHNFLFLAQEAWVEGRKGAKIALSRWGQHSPGPK